MQETDGLQLEELTVRELQELKGRVEAAIRAAIRKRAEQKAGFAAAAPAPAKIDLEVERDAWMAARQRGIKG